MTPPAPTPEQPKHRCAECGAPDPSRVNPTDSTIKGCVQCFPHWPHRLGLVGKPKHRSDRPVDACSMLVDARWRSENPCWGDFGSCPDYPPRHAAARVAEDERRAL